MSLTRHDGKNGGSLAKIYLKLKEEITDTSTPLDDTDLSISDDITLTGSWTELQIKPGDGSWQEVQGEDESGTTYSFTVQAVLHSDRQTVTESLAGFVGRELMCIVKDRNDGLYRLIGEAGLYDYHARLTYSQVKERTPGRNSYDIVITCTMHHPACYYSGAIA